MQLNDFLTERSLSKKEKGKKEKYVKGMKGAKSDFVDRYGKDAKAVMYATATKMAKESLEEKKMVTFQTSVGGFPGYDDHTPLNFSDYEAWELKTDKSNPKKNIISQRYQLYLNAFQQYVDESAKDSLKALARHVKEGVPLPDSLFRYQSEAYFDTFIKAKQLREMGSLPELDWESEEMLSTDIGESFELENGETVWLDVPYLDESEMPDLNDEMIGVPDNYYDEEERRDAFVDLQDALTGGWEDQYVIDGVCPNCAGTGYQDAEDEIYNDETDEYEEGLECDGWGPFGCDEGEMQGATWKEIIAFDQQNVDRQKAKDNYPGDEAVIQQIANMVKNMEDPRQVYRQMQVDYPHMGRAQRSSLIAKGMKKAGLTTENLDYLTKSMYNDSKLQDIQRYLASIIGEPNFYNIDIVDLEKRLKKMDPALYQKYADEKKGLLGEDSELDSNEAAVAKMLAKALGDENRWTEMSPHELYAELESENPEMADVIKLTAKMIYDVKLHETSAVNKGYTFDTDGPDLVITSPQGKTKVFKDFTYFDEPPSQAELKSFFYRGKSLRDESINEGEERSIISDKIVDKVADEFEDIIDTFDSKEQLEYSIYNEISSLDVEDVVDPRMEVGGQPIGDFAGGRVIDVIDSSSVIDDIMSKLDLSQLKEAEYNGKKVQLNKPKRGGSKKYYVYVKNPKTDRVKKISFGDVTGLRTKSGNKKRAKSFAARHNCEKKNDKMKAGYWACRLPRYGRLKGGKWW